MERMYKKCEDGECVRFFPNSQQKKMKITDEEAQITTRRCIVPSRNHFLQYL